MASNQGRATRCAIYTRKSAEERADVQLGTIENQRDLCEKYIASQAGEGWTTLLEHYDDPGYSGGTLRRPALQNLIAAVEAGQVDMIVVYKIDRLSRSLRDFVGLVEHLEAHGVKFVAVTQAFNTANSMGRLTLNILLSFAQFERELTSERLKDWFAGARARGLWQGPAPYGYHVANSILTVNEDQARFVRHIFRRYPTMGSAKEVADEITRMGALNTWGRSINGWQVMRILRNRLYLGDLPHKGQFLPGIHPPIVTAREWDKAADAIDKMSRRRRPALRLPAEAPLYPLLHDRHGASMIHIICRRARTTHRYYVPSRQRYGVGSSPGDRFRAAELEHAVVTAVAAVGYVIAVDGRPGSLTGALSRLIDRIDIMGDEMTIQLRSGAALQSATMGRVMPTARTILKDA
ncbi:recombinase family protein [Sphingobium sp. Z007]|uniref:recombinase family protein n=1 Tax=Sphingobium sp. Z007 TaxID=627495 RepID=UPI0015961985|nr:recombinase family protein [Sphingobium sp. Z007]